MATVASTVTVVTTDGSAGRFGQTVSSFCSVSADPPRMLVCLRSKSPICNAIDGNDCFAINVVPVHQISVANTFAGRVETSGGYDFSKQDWLEDRMGCPVLRLATATFSCALQSRVVSATHHIYIGNVVSVEIAQTPPLIYRERAYGRYLSLS